MTAGSQAPNAPPLDRTVPYTGHQHEIHRFLEVVGQVGATPVTLEPRLHAVGTATIAVHWCVSLGSYGPLYRARHRVPTSWRLHCPVCGASGLQHDCRSSHHASFVADVTLDEVLAEALDLLATETTRASTR